MKRRRFVLRTIQDGQIKIYGRIFRPSAKWLEYDGRLDGLRYAFGLYWVGNNLESFVELWGSEKDYRAAADEQQWDDYCKVRAAPPEVVYSEELQNWYYPWATWKAVALERVTTCNDCAEANDGT